MNQKKKKNTPKHPKNQITGTILKVRFNETGLSAYSSSDPLYNTNYTVI